MLGMSTQVGKEEQVGPENTASIILHSLTPTMKLSKNLNESQGVLDSSSDETVGMGGIVSKPLTAGEG